jgi:alanine racemase
MNSSESDTENITSPSSRIRAEIDLGAIICNLDSMHRNLKPGTMMTAVIKADAYGHGAVRIAQETEKLPYLWGYATATFEEAEELRSGGIEKPILVLGYTFPYCYEGLCREGIRPAVFREDTLEQLSAAAEKTGRKAFIHIAVDTGMNRIGIRPDDSGLAFVKKASRMPGLELEGMFTHFARADEHDKSSALSQLQKFTLFRERIATELGLHIPIADCSNSAGIVELPEANLDMVRAGITMYGLWPSDEISRSIVPLRPALSLCSSVVYLKKITAGDQVSYGGTYTAQRDTLAATVSAGYGDGYPRTLSGKNAYVLIRGRRAPILGRICMDQFMVDVTDIPGVSEGDRVTLIGRDGSEEITAEQLGSLSGRFNYELVCDISRRVPRIYVKKP